MASGELVPPYSNRGVLRTTQSALRACVDWVQVTFTFGQNLQRIYEILGINESEFLDQPAGLYGYRSHKKCGHISVLYDGSDGMGIHVQMSGQGCREYETFHGVTWKQFFMSCMANEANFTRVDVAIDDIAYVGQQPYFTVNRIYRKIKEGCCKSVFFKGKYIESLELGTGDSLGETLYFGKDQSDVQIRMYEKNFERMHAGKEIQEDITHWNRVEVQARRSKAQAVVLYLVNHDDVAYIVKGILKNYISFLVKNDRDSNRRRWAVCKWWLDFLDNSEKLKLSMSAPDMTIERAKSWFAKQVEPTMGMLFYAMGSDWDYFVEAINNGMERMTENQKRIAEEFMRQREAEKEEWDYLKRKKWQEYMFRTINTAKKEVAAATDDQDEWVYSLEKNI